MVHILGMAFRGRKLFGAFKKRAPGMKMHILLSVLHTFRIDHLYTFFAPPPPKYFFQFLLGTCTFLTQNLGGGVQTKSVMGDVE